MREFRISLDHLPAPELNPNVSRRLHWAARARSASDAREEMGWLAKAEWKDQPYMAKAIINYTFIVTDNRRRDAENLLAACKPLVDGIVDAGVILDDDSRVLSIGSVKVEHGDKEALIIEIVEQKS